MITGWPSSVHLIFLVVPDISGNTTVVLGGTAGVVGGTW